RTNTSVAPFASPTTRLVASLRYATVEPSALMTPEYESPFAAPAGARLTRTVVSVAASRTKMFSKRLSSALEMPSDWEAKTTKRPSALAELCGPPLLLLELTSARYAPEPDGRETRVSVCAVRSRR